MESTGINKQMELVYTAMELITSSLEKMADKIFSLEMVVSEIGSRLKELEELKEQ